MKIHPPDITRKILRRFGTLARPPPIAVARPDPQESLPFDSHQSAPPSDLTAQVDLRYSVDSAALLESPICGGCWGGK
jgi:hypothetical protein